MAFFICPVCESELIEKGRSLVCKNGHNFDISKSGYVNLLLSSKKAKIHGDDKMMVISRKNFLDKGYYKSLLDALCEKIYKNVDNCAVVLDAGCGECFYTQGIYRYLNENDINVNVLGIDVSKNALKYGAKRENELKLAVSSIFKMPIKSSCCDVVINVFAPFCGEEFLRVLKTGGILVTVIPLERHLFSLKEAIYDKPYENDVKIPEVKGFTLENQTDVTGEIFIDNNEDIINLFKMTPYYYKTGQKDQAKLERLNEVNTEIRFKILIYRKIV